VRPEAAPLDHEAGQGRHAGPDLVARNFAAAAPDRLWTADITYVPTWSGFLYLAVVIDAFSRAVVGWSMRADLTADLVVEALEMPIYQRDPDTGVIHHSDQGCQYTSLAFGRRCRDAGIVSSMGSAGDCFDNALTESFFATLECELIDRSVFYNHGEARSPSSISSSASTTLVDVILQLTISAQSRTKGGGASNNLPSRKVSAKAGQLH